MYLQQLSYDLKNPWMQLLTRLIQDCYYSEEKRTSNHLSFIVMQRDVICQQSTYGHMHDIRFNILLHVYFSCSSGTNIVSFCDISD